MKIISILLLAFLLISCSEIKLDNQPQSTSSAQYISVLGVAQDAGFPQAGCEKEQCRLFWEGKVEARHATSLGLIDQESGKFWMFEATPDFKYQLETIKKLKSGTVLGGIFLTHAHIGHYTGLMNLGTEVMGGSNAPVYAMPRMKNFLTTNGPWSQLINYGNISISELKADSAFQISDQIRVTPFLVPHRDEFSETVGYRIESDSKSVLFIPDINKWEVWDRSIIDEIAKVDYALLDATFFDSDELPGRNMSDIPHPFVEESIALFKDLPVSEKSKIIFIHFNHTNPLILDSRERTHVESLGFKVAYEGMRIEL
ncbi:MAG: pyrroloquinoline quinone biosynthesis protein PqqB [Balneolaceae bacterium]|nr:pyrroloquinoline quinone biosynthesis protein PqqB [Balneolaceae bacterium]